MKLFIEWEISSKFVAGLLRKGGAFVYQTTTYVPDEFYIQFFWFTFIISLALSILIIVAEWKVFEKAGEPGWGAIVPFYNNYLLFKIAYGNGWYFLWLFVPFINIYFSIMVYIKLAEAFGESIGFGIGLIFLNVIFLSILGFGNSEYQGISYTKSVERPRRNDDFFD